MPTKPTKFGLLETCREEDNQVVMTQLHKSKKTSNKPPELYGLVLAGGKSRRMGQDKGLMVWHDKPQRYHVADLLNQFCSKVYLSCRPDQVSSMAAGYDLLVDTEDDAGQFGAILSALTSHRQAAWLVVACDLPLIDVPDLAYLISQRDHAQLATTFANAEGLPEPLAAIWEPASRQRLVELRAAGVTCPRKALIRSAAKVKRVIPPRPFATMNVNTPEDSAVARKLIHQLQESR